MMQKESNHCPVAKKRPESRHIPFQRNGAPGTDIKSRAGGMIGIVASRARFAKASALPHRAMGQSEKADERRKRAESPS